MSDEISSISSSNNIVVDAVPEHYRILPKILGTEKASRYMSVPRPLVTSMATGSHLTQRDLIKRRLTEHLSGQALLLRIGLPIFVTWNQVQESHIADTEKHGHIEVGTWDELRVAVVSIAPNMLYSYGVAIFETTAAAWLLREPGCPFSKSVVFESELPLRLWPHYVGNILESWWLPRRWSLLGEPPTKVEVDYFESNVSFACAFEDSLKRHTLSALANCVCTTVAQLAMLSRGVRKLFATRSLHVPKQHRRDQFRVFSAGGNSASSSSSLGPRYVWTEAPAPTVKTVLSNIGWKWARAGIELFGGAACGALGTLISGKKGGSAEYWFTMAPWFCFTAHAAYKALGQQYQKLKEDINQQVESKGRNPNQQHNSATPGVHHRMGTLHHQPAADDDDSHQHQRHQDFVRSQTA